MAKTRFTLVVVFSLLLITSAASAQVLYDNGPINGQIEAWTINFGFALGNTFFLSNPSTVTGLAFGAWLTPGDVLQSAEVSITSDVLGGTTYFDQDITFTASGCFVNNVNYEVCTETGLFHGPMLNGGTYWLNLQNAITADGNPAYWDQNDGIGCNSPGCPSMASNGGVMDSTIPSEAFSVLGTPGGGGTTPEPGSLVLFASGLIASVTLLRRKLS
ncbi:MAG TPA: PEP-CTERM sorting domain-containing protein [Terriglobales bacterium]|jgi:hypothetical protein